MATISRYQVEELQGWLDLSERLYGTAEHAFALAVLNGAALTDVIVAGSFILYDTALQRNATVLLIYENNHTNPATAFSDRDRAVLERKEGISIWAIDLDFVIQEG